MYKGFLMLIFAFLMLFIFVGRDLICMLFLVIACLFGGMFMFSFESLCELEGAYLILGSIFFPVMMFYGIFRAIKEVLIETGGELLADSCEIATGGVSAICEL
jgi:hypothetical protein